MSHVTKRLAAGILGGAVLLGACTVKKQETPALTGPSELSTSISISVTPDVIFQDGASQSLVTITARDTNGQPLRNLPLRAEIAVNGIITDFGTLSARSLVTDANGRATLTYTAPAAPAVAVDTGTVVQIRVTPSGTDFGNATARFATIRLVPAGVVGSPNDLKAVFAPPTPTAPTEDNTVLFDATESIAANPNVTIVSYQWDFGDGTTASGKQVTHKFKPGNYTVTLTIKDATNRSGSTRRLITVLPALGPTADFVVSPSDPLVNQPVNFNASTSKPAPGHRIVSYAWDFGDGTFGSGEIVSHSYSLARNYNVLLTVTDDVGNKATATKPVSPK